MSPAPRTLIGFALALLISSHPAIAADHAPAPAPEAPTRTLGGVSYQSLIHDVTQLHLTYSNFGALGNNFLSRAASLEYPIGTGYEHLTHGGLWVGAHAEDGVGKFIGVATAGFDQNLAIDNILLSEFTPASAIVRRSIHPLSSFFDPLAVSDLDAIAQFDDLTPRNAWNNSETHRPMGLDIRQEIYGWIAGSLEDIVFVRYVVRALQPLTNVWLGMFTELASGPKSSYVNWPPSSSDPSGLGGWFTNKWVVYEDSLRLLREHYCAAQPVPAGCILNRTPPWIGVKLLTPPDAGAGQQRTVAAWSWNPSAPWHNQDVERYAIMSAGTASTFEGDSLVPQTGDPVELMAIGPFANLAPGDSAEFAVAFIGAPDEETLRDRARLSQLVHDVGYSLALTPTQASLIEHRVTAAGVRLLWWNAGGGDAPSAVERRDQAEDWRALGAPDRVGEDRLEFFDTTARPGARYLYRLRWNSGATSGEAEVFIPESASFGLRVLGGHPSTRDAVMLGVSVAAGADARLEIFDVTGRIVHSQHLSSGDGAERLLRPARVAPGVYLARLTQGSRRAVARFVVVE